MKDLCCRAVEAWSTRPLKDPGEALVAVKIRERHLRSLSGAGAKSGDDVVALGGKEVAVERTRETGTGGEASAAQHLARVEPGLRVILVGIGSKARERHEAGRRPFPHIPDHLPASEGAVARGARGDVERAVEGKTEIGASGARRRLAPRPAALEVGQASRTWLAHGGSLPFSLGGQPALGPVAVCLRLVPVNEGYRGVRRERFDFVVAAPRPAVALVIEPVGRMLRT